MERPKHSPKIIAHRGYGSQHSKHILSAIRTATAARVEMIEIDVHETRDGHFIVHHDDAIQRDSPVWRQMTYSQLQQFKNHHEQAPLLSECLQAIGSTPVDIEIKSYVDANRLARKLSTSVLAPGSMVSSADYQVLEQLHIRGIEVPLVLILAISHRRSIRQNLKNTLLCLAPRRLPPFLGGVAIHYHLARKRLVYKLQRKGIKVLVWTVDERKAMKKFISLGVDGIITNYPDRLYKILGSLEQLK